MAQPDANTVSFPRRRGVRIALGVLLGGAVVVGLVALGGKILRR